MIIPQELREKIDEAVSPDGTWHGCDGCGCYCCDLLEKLWQIVEVEENS